MKASYRWLLDLISAEVSKRSAGGKLGPELIRDMLTARCATVESVVPVRGELADIVIGRVVNVARHPQADRLWLTKVDAGTGELLDVVCGAANVREGTLYPFAHVGATLPGGVKIERRTIRGQLSNGMLCSAHELGLGADHEGIMALDIEARPGARFAEVSGLGDFCFDIDVLPNRPDLLSHYGLARELAPALGARLADFPGPPNPGRAKPAAAREARSTQRNTTGGVSIRIDDVAGCPRYAAVVIRGVKVGPAPRDIAARLEAIGVRSINNVVDVTNYMLHGYGQPMHAFDLAKLGSEVTIRRARAREKLVTLEGVERTLTEEMTVIAGRDRAEAIAGVIGGKPTEVTDATTDILLEVAVFEPKRVRRTRRALGISTDASYRFERHTDVDAVPRLAEFAAGLIAKVTGGRVADKPLDVYPAPRPRATVALRPARAAHVLGDEIPAARIRKLLTTVGFEASGRGQTAIKFDVPSWRGDIAGEIDLIEEVARLHGYDTFPSDLRPFRPTTVPDDPMVAVAHRVRAALVAAGMMEARPMPFVADATDERLRVRNPLAENEAYLRESILATLGRRAEHNFGQMQRSVRLFEIGTVFAATNAARPLERVHVGAVVIGDREPAHFTAGTPPPYDAWDVKWLADHIASTAFMARDIKLIPVADLPPVGASTATGESPIWLIEVDEKEAGRVVALDLDAPVWAAQAYGIELDLTDAATIPPAPVPYQPLPTTPAVELDLALIVPDDIAAEQVRSAIRTHGEELLERVVLFDEFRGAAIQGRARSLAWRLTFRHPARTLRDQEVAARLEKIVRALEEELGVRQRTS